MRSYSICPLKICPLLFVESQKSDVTDEDLLRALAMQQPSGPRAPDPLTANQRRIVKTLLDEHGDNFEAMARDRKLNKMLLPVGKLKRMTASYSLYKEGGRVRFQQPKRGLM